ncbi:hypothetical protein EPA93_08510 [Ktedonosporobacter rubrisoli]|uniref:YvlB/LiaX N-terminal domain-containing protein n=1 Tax=Ktedonosporobacter rubrisoli TaxID=2509675 RepID=A0A4P6JLH4_KTERU|nr:hypothetical protein [Ktedonosporobacter rubrisoli]QBD76045.1 hypothetical protein EPA93_08510 [Ktedonosporobacter rubrisoli]
MTSEERKKILEMVATGKLTVEQADQLMDILSTKSATDAEKRPEKQRTGEYTQEFMGRIRGYGKSVEKGLRAAGLMWDSSDADLTKYGISAAYLRGLQEAGLGELTTRDIISLKNYSVDADYARALMDLDIPDLSVKHLITLKNYGIDAEYVRALREAGLSNLTAKNIINLKIYQVDADEVRAWREAGYIDPVEHILSLKKRGG